MSDSLFVYGTLLPGRENAHVLAPLAGSWEPAWLPGRLYPGGLGAALGYPVLILDAQGERVDGQLFSAAGLADYWDALDAFEGSAYRRVLTSVNCQGGQRQAWVYVFSEP